MPISPQDKLVALLSEYRGNPVAFVKGVFGATPTGQQIELLNAAVKPHARCAVKSATSTGKTTALAWLTFYFLICYPDCKGLVTAPTAAQLFRVFKSELFLWHGKMHPLFKPFFEIMNEKIYIVGKKDTQFFSWATGSAENKESFAGLHAEKVVLFVDEASALPKEIFDTLYGTLSYGDTSFVLVSNPVRAEGAFYDLFSKGKGTWQPFTFTAFDSPNVNEAWIEETRDYYGEDSDFYKMRVLGEFPILSEAQFISSSAVDEAQARQLMPSEYHNYDRILGCDVARFGKDSSVIVDRQGPKVHEILSFKGLDTTEFTEKILSYYKTIQGVTAIAVDGIGIGAGVVDQLKRFNVPVIDVNVSTKSSEPKTYFNLRAQLYGKVKEWIETADIPRHDGLRDNLVAINYAYNTKLQIILESKKDMRKRGQDSPDEADALSLTMVVNTLQYTPQRMQPRKINKVPHVWA